MTLPASLVFGQGFTEDEIKDLGLENLQLGACSRECLLPEASVSDSVQPHQAGGAPNHPQSDIGSPEVAGNGVTPTVPTAPMSWADRIKKKPANSTQPAAAPAAAAIGTSQSVGEVSGAPQVLQSPAMHTGETVSGEAMAISANTATLECGATDQMDGALEPEEDKVASIPESTTGIAQAAAANTAGNECADPALSALMWLASAPLPLRAEMVYLQPRGLVNNGSTCYMNSILQALLACPPFTLFLHKLSQALPELGASETPTLHALGLLAKEFGPTKPLSSETPSVAALGGAALNPRSMDPVMRAFSPANTSQAAPGEPDQHDAQEFLTFTLDAAHQELLSLRGKDSLQTLGSSPGGHDEEEWEQVGRGNKSAVTRGQASAQGGTSYLSSVFGGALWSEVRTPGARPSATKQHFSVLPLDIYPDSVDSVEAALHLHTSPETITGYRAEGSRQAVDATKRVQLLELPQILVLHLMRFTFGASGTGKLHKSVSYGPVLRLKPAMLADGCTTSRGRAVYDLVAVVQHHGRTPTVGHYTADVRYGGRTGQWLHLNDSSVSTAGDQDVMHGQAYLLFYIRRDD